MDWKPLPTLALAAILQAPLASAADRIELYDATLQDFVEWSAQHLKKSVVVGSDIRSAPISIFATYSGPKELEQLLENAVIASGLHFSSTPSTLRISAQAVEESPDLTTEVLQLQHLQSDFAHQAVRDVLTSRRENRETGQDTTMVSPSPTSNALIVTATRSQLEAIRQVVREIDRPRRQVIITAVVAELADSDFEALGLNVGLDKGRVDASGISLRTSDKSDLGFSLTFSGPTLSAFLQAVKATGNNRILSTPQLLTLNREPASIVVGQNVPFITGQTTSGATPASDPFQTIVRQDVGVTLEVTPFITPADAIELEVNQSASSVADDKAAADIITNTRRISTRVQLQDGEGVLLGGLRSEQTDRSESAVPILSAIPLLGPLFRSTSTRSRSTNLVVLLTARIHGAGDSVKASDAVRPLALPDLSAAEPGIGAAGDGLGRAKAGRKTSL
ncbi:secretin N-terminal domain-containing protein [Metapseudomonas furukawaii]|uniref:General secretion pathway protein D n=1 Tax=Metapseudomonas furukawaii TaxID=1149133 RepID=A0AAD1FH48_METFU|nr:secretin N-terminal domain-containing protein [Pseudomonas furukawaii]ELS29322.1 PulD [Pseudomonas furukawaii]BAU76510.1 general secretion pathway protein D [Pseudomonas furukawaii]